MSRLALLLTLTLIGLLSTSGLLAGLIIDEVNITQCITQKINNTAMMLDFQMKSLNGHFNCLIENKNELIMKFQDGNFTYYARGNKSVYITSRCTECTKLGCNSDFLTGSFIFATGNKSELEKENTFNVSLCNELEEKYIRKFILCKSSYYETYLDAIFIATMSAIIVLLFVIILSKVIRPYEQIEYEDDEPMDWEIGEVCLLHSNSANIFC